MAQHAGLTAKAESSRVGARRPAEPQASAPEPAAEAGLGNQATLGLLRGVRLGAAGGAGAAASADAGAATATPHGVAATLARMPPGAVGNRSMVAMLRAAGAQAKL